jgi:hypothetical protein
MTWRDRERERASESERASEREREREGERRASDALEGSVSGGRESHRVY